MKAQKTVHCDKCADEIKSKDNLVVTNSFLEIVPYHNKCYSETLKSGKSFLVGNMPINGTMSNISTAVALILGVTVLFFPGMRYWSIAFFIYILIRLYVWFKYERLY